MPSACRLACCSVCACGLQHARLAALSKLGAAAPQHRPYALPALWLSPVSPTLAGLVFFAFGLNMVDCGGLLGGRLGKDAQKVVKARADPGMGRTMTL